jgi:hypothetical protein
MRVATLVHSGIRRIQSTPQTFPAFTIMTETMCDEMPVHRQSFSIEGCGIGQARELTDDRTRNGLLCHEGQGYCTEEATWTIMFFSVRLPLPYAAAGAAVSAC